MFIRRAFTVFLELQSEARRDAVERLRRLDARLALALCETRRGCAFSK